MAKNVSIFAALLLVLVLGLPGCRGGSNSPDGIPAPAGSASGAVTGGSAPSDGVGSTVCPDPQPSTLFRNQRGEGTFYDVSGPGSCSFPLDNDHMIAAINSPQYQHGAACGACLKVRGPQGEVVVRVVDRCPECRSGDLDLSEVAFSQIADPSLGRVDIAWDEVPCPIEDPVRYYFKPGSSQWWVAVQVRNHRNRVARFDVLDNDGRYRELPRVDYNYFVASEGLGSGPLTFRITDLFGHSIEDGSIVLQPGQSVVSQGQFPLCH